MKGTIKLANPITVNGKTLAELQYNTDEITGALFCEAEAKYRSASGSKNVNIAPAAEFDYGLHLHLGFAACIAAAPEIDFADFTRIHGSDIVKFMEVGRNFILKSEDSDQNNSDEPTENTAAPSTPA